MNGYNEDCMNTYPNGHLSLLCHLTGIQVCETLKSQKNKASDKRLFLYVIPPLRFCLSDCFKVRMWQIYNLFLNKDNGLVFFFKEMLYRPNIQTRKESILPEPSIAVRFVTD